MSVVLLQKQTQYEELFQQSIFMYLFTLVKHNKENCFTLSNGAELEIISGIIE